MLREFHLDNMRPSIGAVPGGIRRHRAKRSDFNADGLLLPKDQIRTGQYKDSIPSLADPKSVPVAEETSCLPTDRIVAVTIDGQTRDYPISILNAHEAVNDTLGPVQIAAIH